MDIGGADCNLLAKLSVIHSPMGCRGCWPFQAFGCCVQAFMRKHLCMGSQGSLTTYERALRVELNEHNWRLTRGVSGSATRAVRLMPGPVQRETKSWLRF